MNTILRFILNTNHTNLCTNPLETIVLSELSSFIKKNIPFNERSWYYSKPLGYGLVSNQSDASSIIN